MSIKFLFPLPPIDGLYSALLACLQDRPVVGLHAGAQCGKTTAAQALERVGFTAFSFAYPLKVAAQAIFALTDEQAFDDAWKNVVIPHVGLTSREIQQRLGTEICRDHIACDIWLRAALVRIHRHIASDEAAAGVVLTDVRFENEAALVRRLKGPVWHIHAERAFEVCADHGAGTRPTDRTHTSESGVAFHDADAVLVNDGTREQLHARVQAQGHALLSGYTHSDSCTAA